MAPRSCPPLGGGSSSSSDPILSSVKEIFAISAAITVAAGIYLYNRDTECDAAKDVAETYEEINDQRPPERKLDFNKEQFLSAHCD